MDGLPVSFGECDDLMAYGERLSSRLYWALLKARGVGTWLVDARQMIVTDDGFSAAQPLEGPTRRRFQQFFNNSDQSGRVYLTQGFIGAAAGGQTTTLGRGGSDYSATFLGALLAAEKVVIWTDTPGILTADPHRVPQARTLSELSYAEAEALALNGAKVLHHRCIEPVQRAEVPVEVRAIMDPAGAYTRIEKGIEADPARFALSSTPFSLQTAAPFCLAKYGYDLDLVGWCGGRLETRTGMRALRALPANLNVQSEFALVFLMKTGLSSAIRGDCLSLLVRHGIPVFFVSGRQRRDHLTLILPKALRFKAVAILHHHFVKLVGDLKLTPVAVSSRRPAWNHNWVHKTDLSRSSS